MTKAFEKHLPTALVLLIAVALVVSFLNREPSQAKPEPLAVVMEIPDADTDDGDFGLKPLIVPASPEVVNAETTREARSRMLWPVDIGGYPSIERRLPETNSDPQPDTATTANGLKIAVIFSGKLSVDCYGEEERMELHGKLQLFAAQYGYDLAIDVDGIRGGANRVCYFASNRVDRTAAFEIFLKNYENMTSASP